MIKYAQIMIAFLLLFSASEASQSVVLVTGATRGIGYCIAELLASEGYRVYAGMRSTSSSEGLLKLKKLYPDSLFPIVIDVTEDSTIETAVNEILKKEGRIDVLVNNAGILMNGSLENTTIDDARKMFEVNFFGMMRVTQAVLPSMRFQKQGKIIQISSRSGFRPLPSLAVYAATKFAMEAVSETLAAVLKPWNIYISLIEPGPVDTELVFFYPFCSRLARENDPYYPIFKAAGLLDAGNAQPPEEVAAYVKSAIEAERPRFRYQTSALVQQQAAKRFLDTTGLSHIDEWDAVLFPAKK